MLQPVNVETTDQAQQRQDRADQQAGVLLPRRQLRTRTSLLASSMS
jgi:hypothetical protein